MDLHPDLIDLLSELEKASAEYLVVGGWAVGVHAEPRYTKDLDLLIGLDSANLGRVADALDRYGAPPALVEQVRTMTVEEFIYFGVPPARVDLLRAIPGIDFNEAWSRRQTVRWSQIAVQVIGAADLIAAKRASGRKKDLEDLAMLERYADKSAK